MRISQKCFKLTWRVIFDVALQGKILLYGYNRYVIYSIFLIYNIHLYAYTWCIKCVCLFVTDRVYIHPIYISHQQVHPLYFTCIFLYSYFWHSFVHSLVFPSFYLQDFYVLLFSSVLSCSTSWLCWNQKWFLFLLPPFRDLCFFSKLSFQ